MCVYCVSVSSFANGMVIAALEGQLEDGKLLYIKQPSVSVCWRWRRMKVITDKTEGRSRACTEQNREDVVWMVERGSQW